MPAAAVASAPAPTAEPAVTPAPSSEAQPASSTHKRIVIDISDQHLWAFDGETEVYRFVASTGLPGLDTRPGVYSVLDEIPSAWAATGESGCRIGSTSIGRARTAASSPA